MHHFKFLKTISLILGFSLVIFGCVTGKNTVAKNDFGFVAESIPEGILLTFSNIPSDAIRMTLHVSYYITEETDSPHGLLSSFADLRDPSFTMGANPSIQLEKVKQTGKVIFPIVQAGQEYSVFAYVYNQQEHDLMLKNDEKHQPVFAHTMIIPQNGTYFNRDDVILELDKDISVVTLISEPVFSPEVTFYDQKYSFGVTIIVPENGSIGVADHHMTDSISSNGLTWVFEPQMTNNLKSVSDWLENEVVYTAWATASANIIYDDIFWWVDIAKSPEFKYSL